MAVAIAQVRRDKEYDTLKECTFEPELHAREEVPQPTGPVVVRGLGRYLELKEMAKRTPPFPTKADPSTEAFNTRSEPPQRRLINNSAPPN